MAEKIKLVHSFSNLRDRNNKVVSIKEFTSRPKTRLREVAQVGHAGAKAAKQTLELLSKPCQCGQLHCSQNNTVV